MKKILKFFLWIFVVIGAIVLFAVVSTFFITRQLPEKMDEFFALAANEQYEEIYATTSSEFHKTTSFEEFVNFLEMNELGTVEDVNWVGRSFHIDSQITVGQLDGEIDIKSQKDLFIRVKFVKENDEWKIQYLEVKGKEIEKKDNNDNIPELSIPAEAEVRTLVNTNVRTLFEDIKSGDYTATYDLLADAAKEGTTAEQVAASFASFVSSPTDFSYIFEVEPEFSSKISLNEDGAVLAVEGKYSGENNGLLFLLHYVYEDGWKLGAIKLQEENFPEV